MKTQPSEGAHAVDVYVGSRLRLRRKAIGFSQTQLADGLGLTFQQIQKYERGANRISASKLYDAATLLKVGIAYFFEGLEDKNGLLDDARTQSLSAFVTTPEGLELARTFPRINDRRVRRQILDLARALAANDDRK